MLFFSAAGCKRAVYILPALPPLALALGCYLNALVAGRALRPSRLAYQAALLVLAAGAAVGLAGPTYHFIGPATGYALAGASVAGAALLVGFRCRVSWPVCAGTTFAALLVAVLILLPAYNQQYSLRDCLHDVPRTPLSVICYPQRWDAVSFYLPRTDVHAYGPEQRAQLLEDVRSHPGTLLLVKTGPLLNDLLRDLPATVEFVRRGRHGAVTAGWVRTRPEPADDLLAEK